MRKTPTQRIVATLSDYQENQRIDIRVYFQPNDKPDVWIPTKRGINLALDNWQDFKDLVKTIDQVVIGENGQGD
jgi:hypothetical protein